MRIGLVVFVGILLLRLSSSWAQFGVDPKTSTTSNFGSASQNQLNSAAGQRQPGTIYHFGSSASKQTIPAIPAPPPPAVQPPPQPTITPPPPARSLEPLGGPGFGHPGK